MSNLVKHAERELDLIGMKEDDSDEMNRMMRKHLLLMIKTFSEEGHSGFSAAYAANALDKLLRYEPLAPLTGEDWEWNEVGEGIYQNNRCSHVFKENGQAYDIDGKVFRDKAGITYTNYKSRVNVTFPYIPHSEIVDDDA